MRPDNAERTYAQQLVSKISQLAGIRGPKHCDAGAPGYWRFDWNKTCRSKYTPHTGAKQRARALCIDDIRHGRYIQAIPHG